ncbi:MAG: MYXO-CTERM sorting domain-containing protein [Myxococcota bacterium]
MTTVVYASGDSGVLISSSKIELNTQLIERQDIPVSYVLAHEIGHAFGLLHPCRATNAPEDTNAAECTGADTGSVMHPLYAADTPIDTASDDDISGLCFLYGDCAGAGCTAGEQGDACTSDTECLSRACDAQGLCSEPCAAGTCASGQRCEAGVCQSTGGGFGDACSEGADCASRLCLTQDGRSTCTRRCESGCPAGSECKLVDERAVCAPPAGGCSAAPNGSPLPVLCLFGFVALRRRPNPST